MAGREEFEAKLDRVGRFLARNDLDGVALSRGDNFAWMGCGADNLVNHAAEVGAATLVVRGGDVTLVANNVETERLLTEELDGLELAGNEVFPWHDPAARTAVIGKLTAGARFAADNDADGLALLPPEFARLRYALTGAEVERYRTLGREASEALEAAARQVERRMTEADVAALVGAECLGRSIAPIVLLVAADERASRWRHPLPKATRVERYAMLVLCGRRGGLIAALSRLVHLGELPEHLRRRHDAVCAVDAAMMAATTPGATAADVFADAQRAYADEGFEGEWRHHHQGGATGYQARDYIANPACEEVVQADQAFAWNPSICGTKSEDTILAREGGFELLTRPSPGWPVVKVEQAGRTVERADILIK